MVDVLKAECSVAADKARELALIDACKVNAAVRQALLAGKAAVNTGAWELEAFRCGEPKPLEALPAERALSVLFAACSVGLVPVAQFLVGKALIHMKCFPPVMAAQNGFPEVF